MITEAEMDAEQRQVLNLFEYEVAELRQKLGDLHPIRQRRAASLIVTLLLLDLPEDQRRTALQMFRCIYFRNVQ